MLRAACLLAVARAASLASSRIDHVIVIFGENRAFDHMFGWQAESLGVDGLTGTESNPIDLTDPSAGNVTVSSGAPYVATFDPNHGFPAYNYKIFGGDDAPQNVSRNSGFYSYEAQSHGISAKFVMSGFSPDALPVSTALAQEFAVFDQFHCAHPGPSWPNQMMMMTGTAAGCTETGSYYGCTEEKKLFPQKTIFQSLLENGHEYKLIYNDSRNDMQIEYFNSDECANRTHTMDAYFHDAAHGTLPALT